MSSSVQNKTGWFINLIKTINTKQLKGHIPPNKPTAGSSCYSATGGKPICYFVGVLKKKKTNKGEKHSLAKITPPILTWETGQNGQNVSKDIGPL